MPKPFDPENMIRKKELASIMSEVSADSYFIYECEDFIELFKHAMLKALSEGKIIQLDGMLRLEPRRYVSKGKRSNLFGDIVDVDTTTLKMVVMPSFREEYKRLKKLKEKENAEDE
jgi:nucleoid DNA-binding protein